MAYTFDSIFAADPSNPVNVATNAAITIYDPADATKTPVTITDVTDAPLTNPITVNKNGFGPAFKHATLDRLAWSGGGFTGFFTSYEGLKNEAVAARQAAETAGADAAAEAAAGVAPVVADAQAAADSAAAAATSASNAADAALASASLVNAPADTAIAAAINGTGTATTTALTAKYATKAELSTAGGVNIRLDALAAGKRLRATTAGSRSVTAKGVTVGTIVPSSTATTVTSPLVVNAYDRTNSRVNTALRVLGTRAVQANANFPRYDYIASDPTIITYAPGTLVGPSMTVETLYGGAAMDVLIRRGGGTVPHVIYVDGLEARTITDADLSAAGVSSGSIARVPLTFVDARPRVIAYYQGTASSEFPGFVINSTYPLAYPTTTAKGPRAMITGDSFTEGTGAGNSPGYARWTGWHMGWKDLWQAGSGSTGYVADGARLALIDRYQNDLITQAPDILVIAMGLNDLTAYKANKTDVTGAATTIWDAVIAQLPATELVIVGPWSPKGDTYVDADLKQMDADLHALAKARGLRFISPIQENWITGNGRVGATTGNGNADIYISTDGTHPSAAGHEYLGWRLAGHLSVPYLEAA